MSQPNDYIYATFITDLLLKLQRYHEKTPSHPARLKTLFVIDECRSVFPGKRDIHDYDADRFMERFITSARSSGIGRITITQEPQSVTSWLTDNSAFFLTFPIAGGAMEHLQKYQNLTDEQLAYIEKLPQKGTGIFRDRRFDRKYLVQVPGDLDIEPISQEETKNIMKPFITKMHAALEAKVIEINVPKEKDYTEQYLDKVRSFIHKEALQILQMLRVKPFWHKTKLREKLGISHKKFDRNVDWLNGNGFIETVECRLKTKPAALYALTEKSHDLLKTPQSRRRPTPRLFKHTFYQIKVAAWLKEQGHNPKIEYCIPGSDSIFQTTTESGKSFVTPQRIDVFAEIDGVRVAYEITLSFKNLDINVHKCFLNMNAERLIIVCENNADMERARRKIEGTERLSELLKVKGECIHYKPIRDFM